MPKYGQLGASSRLRTAQYLPYFRDAGIEVKYSALFDDDYVRDLYAGSHNIRSMIRGYLGRLRALLTARAFDVLLVEKESLPWLPALVELGLYRDVPLWVDYDDAIFHRYDLNSSSLVRKVLGHKLDAVMKRAQLVTAGNAYLAQRALSAGSQWVERVPTVIDLARYSDEPKVLHSREEVIIGWIGSPSTAGYLQLVSGALSALQHRYNIRCVAIGARADQLIGTPFTALPWSEETEVDLLRSLDIGIMPLLDTPWENGKCGYKLIQYMACGLPVVASPVGVNSEIVSHGSNGFLAPTEDAWMQSIEALIRDADMRDRMGRIGRQYVEQKFCLQVQGPRLVGLLQKLGPT